VVSPLMLALTTRAFFFLVGQLLFEQRHPAGAALEAVFGAQGVTDDQHGSGLGGGGGRLRPGSGHGAQQDGREQRGQRFYQAFCYFSGKLGKVGFHIF
jgi:hypothetical protein